MYNRIFKRRPRCRPIRRRGLMACIGAALIFSVLGLTACSGGTSTQTGSSETASDTVNVVASFYPMADFAQKIGGDHVKVTTLVPAGTEPHEWESSPSDVKQIQASDVFIYNGADMEGWVDDTLESIDTSKTTVCKASDGIELRTAIEEEDSADEHETQAGTTRTCG